MQNSNLAFHYVCTHEAAWQLARGYERFWVSNCGCRESRGQCNRSRLDVCLLFREDFPPTGSEFREIYWANVEGILQEAADKHLVARPFRNEEDMTRVDGICFCCDDCCAYFRDPSARCDKGVLIENTAKEQCTDCATCVDVCYFGARELSVGELTVGREKCFGCGLCVDVCPEDCIEMIQRTQREITGG